MKLLKGIAIILSVFMVVGLMVACDTGDDTTTTSNNNQKNNEFDEKGTVQGTVFDAVSGARLAGDVLESLEITLVMGTTYKSPSKLVNNGGDDETTFDGDYAFTNVPVTLGDQAEYRVVVTATGYQQFEGYISLEAEYWPTADVDGDDGNNNTIDTVYNYIKNIYIFPLGATAPELNYYVRYDNEPVANATVHLDQLTASNTETAATTRVWAADNGLIGMLAGTTDATGLVTFAGSSLVLGGAYQATVLPVVHEGVQLAWTKDATVVTVGPSLQDHIQVITLTDSEPGNADGLYATYASNNVDPDDVIDTGVVTVVFNRPIKLVSEDAVTAAIACDAYDDPALDLLEEGNAADAGNVDVTVSADGYTLTFTPDWNSEPLEGYDVGCTITYAGAQVMLANDDQSDAGVFNVNAILLPDGATTVDLTVNVTSNFVAP